MGTYPDIDFCKNPGAICDSSSPPELKWVAGLFYWLNAVQPYSSDGWNYIDKLRKWVDAGFINGASGIVNRGCHNPPNCGTGDLHAGEERKANFKKVLSAMGLRETTSLASVRKQVRHHGFLAPALIQNETKVARIGSKSCEEL